MRARQEEVGEEAPWRDPEQNWGSGGATGRGAPTGGEGWGVGPRRDSQGPCPGGGVTRWPGVAARTGPS